MKERLGLILTRTSHVLDHPSWPEAAHRVPSLAITINRIRRHASMMLSQTDLCSTEEADLPGLREVDMRLGQMLPALEEILARLDTLFEDDAGPARTSRP